MINLLEVKDLKKHFWPKGRRGNVVRAVDGISFDVKQGSTLAIVGESGSGKSTAGRAILRLIEPTSGQVTFAGTDLLGLSEDDLRRFRSRMQIVFQDNYASLDPRWTIGRILSEPLALHTELNKTEIRHRIEEMLETVGLEASHANRYPHEFSGGQRQRVGIARALMMRPELVVCDEPVSALDVSVQAQVLNLMKDLQEELGLTYVFISHDLSVVEFMADEIIVMKNGVIVESGVCEQVMDDPQHPYTRALFAAVPIPDPAVYKDRSERRQTIREGLQSADEGNR